MTFSPRNLKMRSLIINTPRLRLVAGTSRLTKAAIENTIEFGRLLDAVIPSAWPHELMKDAEAFVADILHLKPDEAGWWVWYIVLKAQNKNDADRLIGSGGFGGLPAEDGTVVIGWGLLDEFQGMGYATEAAIALIDWAFAEPVVTRVVADTYPYLKASIRVMEKCGMTFIGPGPEEGTIRYAKKRPLE